jgi:hypothetical protein
MCREIYEAMRLKITVPTEGKPRIKGNLDQNIIRLTREVEEWATDVTMSRVSSKQTDSVMAEVAT